LTERGENRFQCVAILAERDVVRYSPAGIPIVSAKLIHESEQVEAGISRRVEFEMAALAAGQIAQQLAQEKLGSEFRFIGFLARKNRNSRSLIFHLTALQNIE
jgi:primosomal replication protein N